MCVVLLLVCFFFKQKTAYEMRISDWSSDVCSSDLVGEMTEIGEADGVLGFLGAFDRLEVDIVDGLRAVAVDQIDVGAADAFDARKIGRASCRERVCQYV